MSKIYKIGNLSDSSKDAYAKAFLKIKEILGMDDEDFLKPLKVLDKIIELDREPTTKKIYVAGIIYALTHFYPEKVDDKIIYIYGGYISRINKELQNKIETNKITEKEKNKLVPWEDVVKLRDTMNVSRGKSITEYMILSLYTLIPPRRVRDYSNMIYVSRKELANNKYFNYVVHNYKSTTFIWNNYKTEKYYGQVKYKANKKLRNVVSYYIRNKKLNSEDHFLESKAGNPFSENHLSSYIRNMFIKHLGKPIGATSLRHMYISHISKDPNLTLSERRKISKRMGHSLYEQLCYRKIGIR